MKGRVTEVEEISVHRRQAEAHSQEPSSSLTHGWQGLKYFQDFYLPSSVHSTSRLELGVEPGLNSGIKKWNTGPGMIA